MCRARACNWSQIAVAAVARHRAGDVLAVGPVLQPGPGPGDLCIVCQRISTHMQMRIWVVSPSARRARRHQSMQRQRRGSGTGRQGPAGQQPLIALALWALALWGPTQCQSAQVTINSGPIGAGPQTQLPPLSSFVQPGVYLGTDEVSLGNTTFRWVACLPEHPCRGLLAET